MNKIYLKLIFVKDRRTIEVIFDVRLSFKDNFRLLKAILTSINIDSFYVFDKNKGVFLDKKEPIKSFEMDNLTTLTIF